jgi:hypothetical protein
MDVFLKNEHQFMDFLIQLNLVMHEFLNSTIFI